MAAWEWGGGKKAHEIRNGEAWRGVVCKVLYPAVTVQRNRPCGSSRGTFKRAFQAASLVFLPSTAFLAFCSTDPVVPAPPSSECTAPKFDPFQHPLHPLHPLTSGTDRTQHPLIPSHSLPLFPCHFFAPASARPDGNPKMPLPNTAQNTTPSHTMSSGQTTVLNGDSPHSTTLRVRPKNTNTLQVIADKWHTGTPN